PLRESLWALLGLALVRSGRQSEALDAFRQIRQTLADDLGVDPGPVLQELETATLQQSAALWWSPAGDPGPRSAEPAAAQPRTAGGSAAPWPMVGRAGELAE